MRLDLTIALGSMIHLAVLVTLLIVGWVVDIRPRLTRIEQKQDDLLKQLHDYRPNDNDRQCD